MNQAGPITIEDLGLDKAFEKIERLADILDEAAWLCEKLRDEDGIEISIKIDLI